MAADHIGTSLAVTTFSGYQTACSSFIRFALAHGVVDWMPFQVMVLIGWVTFLFNIQKVAYSTVKKYLTGLKSMGRLLGADSDAFTNPMLYYCVCGIRKKCTHRAQTGKRLPITVWVLALFREKLTNYVRDVMLLAVLVVGVFGLLRAGEMTDKGAGCPMLRKDGEDHVEISIRFSKTDPFREGTVVRLGKTGAALCPKCACAVAGHRHPISP